MLLRIEGQAHDFLKDYQETPSRKLLRPYELRRFLVSRGKITQSVTIHERTPIGSQTHENAGGKPGKLSQQLTIPFCAVSALEQSTEAPTKDSGPLRLRLTLGQPSTVRDLYFAGTKEAWTGACFLRVVLWRFICARVVPGCIFVASAVFGLSWNPSVALVFNHDGAGDMTEPLPLTLTDALS